MAGGNLYIEPILSEMTEKISNIVDKVDDMVDIINTKIQAQIDELRIVADSISISADPDNVRVSYTGSENKIKTECNFITPQVVNVQEQNIAMVECAVTGSIRITLKNVSAHWWLSGTSGSTNYTATASVALYDDNNTLQTPINHNDLSHTYNSGVMFDVTETGDITADFNVVAGETYNIKLKGNSGLVLTWGVYSMSNTDAEISFKYISSLNPDEAIIMIPANE